MTVSAERLVKWLVTSGFSQRPMAFMMLSFLADGPAGARAGAATIADISRLVESATERTAAGAGKLLVHEGGGHVLVDELGLVCIERSTGLLVSEHIPHYIKVAVSLMYHSVAGKALTSSAAMRAALLALSRHEGEAMDSPRSRRGIAAFVAAHKINVSDNLLPIESYKTFNEFFTRKLAPSARPVASPGDDSVVCSPADCRLCAFPRIEDAVGVWVKGERFTVPTLLGPRNADAAAALSGGSVVIARLAPQDYHRFHCGVSGRVVRRCEIDGALFTVNPIAIRQPRPCVYTSNKRVVSIVESRAFGVVAFVAIGATAVGSITMTAPMHEPLDKGDEAGFFAFGGSTVLILFQPGACVFDADLTSNSMRPLETIVRANERIGAATGAKGLRQTL
jgi:phosphatidylserine decarboxylase